MNERIRQLLNEATVGLEPDLSPQRTVTLNEMEKFAELIVRECVESLWTEECYTSDLALKEFLKNSKKIKQNFGVKE